MSWAGKNSFLATNTKLASHYIVSQPRDRKLNLKYVGSDLCQPSPRTPMMWVRPVVYLVTRREGRDSLRYESQRPALHVCFVSPKWPHKFLSIVDLIICNSANGPDILWNNAKPSLMVCNPITAHSYFEDLVTIVTFAAARYKNIWRREKKLFEIFQQ